MGKHVGHRIFLWLLGITFQDRTSILSHVINGGPQQFHRNAFAPMGSRYKKAGYGPDGLVVDPLKDAGTFQSRIGFARCQRTPSHRLITNVREQTRCIAALDNSLQRPLVCIAFLRFVLGSLQAP